MNAPSTDALHPPADPRKTDGDETRLREALDAALHGVENGRGQPMPPGVVLFATANPHRRDDLFRGALDLANRYCAPQGWSANTMMHSLDFAGRGTLRFVRVVDVYDAHRLRGNRYSLIVLDPRAMPSPQACELLASMERR